MNAPKNRQTAETISRALGLSTVAGRNVLNSWVKRNGNHSAIVHVIRDKTEVENPRSRPNNPDMPTAAMIMMSRVFKVISNRLYKLTLL